MVDRIVPWGAPALQRAVATLWRGGLIVYPTETFYALGCVPSCRPAVRRLQRLKGREPQGGKGLPLIAAGITAVQQLGTLPPPLAALAARHWPGALTLCLQPHAPDRFAAVAAADGSVGVRVSSHPVAQALASGNEPALLVASSANLGGEPPGVTVAALPAALLAAVDLVIDGGHLEGGAPSTVVRQLPGQAPQVLRQGRIRL